MKPRRRDEHPLHRRGVQPAGVQAGLLPPPRNAVCTRTGVAGIGSAARNAAAWPAVTPGFRLTVSSRSASSGTAGPGACPVCGRRTERARRRRARRRRPTGSRSVSNRGPVGGGVRNPATFSTRMPARWPGRRATEDLLGAIIESAAPDRRLSDLVGAGEGLGSTAATLLPCAAPPLRA